MGTTSDNSKYFHKMRWMLASLIIGSCIEESYIVAKVGCYRIFRIGQSDETTEETVRELAQKGYYISQFLPHAAVAYRLLRDEQEGEYGYFRVLLIRRNLKKMSSAF